MAFIPAIEADEMVLIYAIHSETKLCFFSSESKENTCKNRLFREISKISPREIKCTKYCQIFYYVHGGCFSTSAIVFRHFVGDAADYCF